MALTYPGGYITKSPPTPTSTSAPGIWTMDQALQYIKAGTWPTPPIGDQYFQYTNLLLGTGSTNGAQNNTFLDSSSNNFSITRNGNTTQGSFTPFSQAAGYWSNYFDGASDRLVPASSSDFSMTADFTVECWVYPLTQTQVFPAVFNLTGTADLSVAYDHNDGTNDSFSMLLGATRTSASITSPANAWYHIALVRSGSTVTLYINGTSRATATTSATLGGTSCIIGMYDTGTSSTSFLGYISNLSVLKGTAKYTSNFTPSTTPLSASATDQKLLTCQANRFVDSNTATTAKTIAVSGNTTVVPFQPFGAPTSPYNTPNVGGSGFFDGTGDYLESTISSTALFNNNFTIEAWIYMTSAPTTQMRIIGGTNFNFYTNNNGTGLGLDDTLNAPSIWTVDSVLKLREWTYVALVRSGNTFTFYVNGVSVGSNSSIFSYFTGNTTSLSVSSTNFFNGYISNVRISNTARTISSTPTTPLTSDSNTFYLLNFTNAAIFDNAAKNDMETVGNAQVSTSVTKFGNSVYMDGSGDYLVGSQPTLFDFGTGDFTIEGWFYFNAINTTGATVLFSTQTTGVLQLGTESDVINLGRNSSSNIISAAYTSSLLLNTWTHIAVSRTGSLVKMFVNGNQIGSGTNSDSFDITTYYLGRQGTTGTHQLNGYISNFRITNGVGRYNYNFPTPTQAFGTIYAAPVTPAADPYFDYTTLLLPGSGTNGAQNNTFLDSSTNAFSITRNGNTTQGTFSPFSQTGWSNYFDGTGDYLSVPDNAAFDLGNGAFTLEAWIYPNDVTPSKAEWILSQWQSDSQNSWGFRIETSGALYFYYSADGNNATVFGADSPGIGERQWNHIAVVRSSNTVTIYVNGSPVSSATVTATFFNSSASVMVGNQANTGLGQTFTGYISNARVVKGTAVYTAAFTPPTSALTAISGTSLLTCQSNRLVDNSANAFTITRNGDVSVQAFSPFAPTAAYSAATNGGSGYFDGTGDYLQIAANSAFNCTGDFTLEFWINPFNNSGSSGYQLYIGGAAGASYFGLKNNQYVAQFSGGGEMFWTGEPTLNVWTHLALVRSGSTVTLYVNGASVGTNTSSAAFLDATNALQIGAYAADFNTKGYLSGFRLVKGTALSITVPTAPPTNITNTSLLLNFTNAGITDATAKNDLETVADAQISNTTAKWGSTSIKFDGTGDYLSRPSTDLFNFGTGDFTVEFWINAAAQTVDYAAVISNSTTSGWGLRVSGTGLNKLQLTNGAAANTSTGVIANSTWNHVAVCRYGSTVFIFINGNLDSTHTNSNSIGFAVNEFRVGRGFTVDGNDGYFNGYIQDLRITKGIARYTQNFPVPTAAFQLL